MSLEKVCFYEFVSVTVKVCFDEFVSVTGKVCFEEFVSDTGKVCFDDRVSMLVLIGFFLFYYTLLLFISLDSCPLRCCLVIALSKITKK